MFALMNLCCCGRNAYLKNNTYHKNSLVSVVLSQAESGYIWKSIFCPGNDTKYVDGCEFQYNATKNAFSLAKDQLNQGYCIYVDNWYTSLEQCANS